jgi:hypothetical protein
MRYLEFKEAINRELRGQPKGLTWDQLQQRLELPYDRPCQTWTRRLEEEIGLSRMKGSGRALLWRVGQSRTKRRK